MPAWKHLHLRPRPRLEGEPWQNQRTNGMDQRPSNLPGGTGSAVLPCRGTGTISGGFCSRWWSSGWPISFGASRDSSAPVCRGASRCSSQGVRGADCAAHPSRRELVPDRGHHRGRRSRHGLSVYVRIPDPGQISQVFEKLPDAIDAVGNRIGINNAREELEKAISSSAGPSVLSRAAGLGYTVVGI